MGNIQPVAHTLRDTRLAGQLSNMQKEGRDLRIPAGSDSTKDLWDLLLLSNAKERTENWAKHLGKYNPY